MICITIYASSPPIPHTLKPRILYLGSENLMNVDQVAATKAGSLRLAPEDEI